MKQIHGIDVIFSLFLKKIGVRSSTWRHQNRRNQYQRLGWCEECHKCYYSRRFQNIPMHQYHSQGNNQIWASDFWDILITLWNVIYLQNEWIEKFEVALKFNQMKKRKSVAPQPPSRQVSVTESNVPKSTTKSSLASDAVSPTSTISEADSINIKYAPEWLVLAQDEIHTLIAQRHFQDALTWITKCEEHFAADSSFYNATEIIQKVKNWHAIWPGVFCRNSIWSCEFQIKDLKNELSTVLLDELSKCQTRSLYAALISSRVKLKLLADMNKEREACGTMLKVCTAAIRSSQQQARRNNLEVSQLFFCDLAQVASEFLKAFKSKGACMSSKPTKPNHSIPYHFLFWLTFTNSLVDL